MLDLLLLQMALCGQPFLFILCLPGISHFTLKTNKTKRNRILQFEEPRQMDAKCKLIITFCKVQLFSAKIHCLYQEQFRYLLNCLTSQSLSTSEQAAKNVTFLQSHIATFSLNWRMRRISLWNCSNGDRPCEINQVQIISSYGNWSTQAAKSKQFINEKKICKTLGLIKHLGESACRDQHFHNGSIIPLYQFVKY